MQEKAKFIASNNNYSIKIGYLKNYTSNELQKAIVEFNRRFSEVEIELVSGTHDELVNKVFDNEIDLKYFANENIDYSKYEIDNIEYKDYIVKSDYYWVVFDRKGRCNWNTNQINYGGKTAKIVMCVTKQASKQYLAHLRSLRISYIIAGDIEINFNETLKKLKDIYGIETLVLTGGAIINGVLHEKGLIDEISLVVGPYIEGNHEYKGFAELNGYANYCYKFKKANPMEDGGVQLIFSK